MIAANVAAAKALESKASPVVYRVHEPPTREKLAQRDVIQRLAGMQYDRNDLEFRRGVDEPTILIPEMTVGAA